jgi:hypothetical protein
MEVVLVELGLSADVKDKGEFGSSIHMNRLLRESLLLYS